MPNNCSIGFNSIEIIPFRVIHRLVSLSLSLLVSLSLTLGPGYSSAAYFQFSLPNNLTCLWNGRQMIGARTKKKIPNKNKNNRILFLQLSLEPKKKNGNGELFQLDSFIRMNFGWTFSLNTILENNFFWFIQCGTSHHRCRSFISG